MKRSEFRGDMLSSLTQEAVDASLARMIEAGTVVDLPLWDAVTLEPSTTRA